MTDFMVTGNVVTICNDHRSSQSFEFPSLAKYQRFFLAESCYRERRPGVLLLSVRSVSQLSSEAEAAVIRG